MTLRPLYRTRTYELPVLAVLMLYPVPLCSLKSATHVAPPARSVKRVTRERKKKMHPMVCAEPKTRSTNLNTATVRTLTYRSISLSLKYSCSCLKRTSFGSCATQ